MTARSVELFEAAQKVMPGGVNSPVRAYGAVGGTPFYADRGLGVMLYDVDGNAYIDYLLSWGPLIWGHAHPRILEAIAQAAARGTSFGVPTEIETRMAEQVIQMVPSIEKVRMVNSGTEATMSALRLARAYTGRSLIVKLEGCYHGHPDALLVKAGSGVATLGLPDSPGVPSAVAESTLTVPYNDAAALAKVFETSGEQIAALIIEPVAGNMGCILPQPGYLEFTREITHKYGSLLIFDEVMTGFRVAQGGAQAHFNIQPDLTTLGKVIGAGLPVGAYGGRADIMSLIAPEGPVYQAGTLSGNPLAMSAGLTSLQMVSEDTALYDRMGSFGRMMVDTFVMLGNRHGIPVVGASIGGMFGLFFHDDLVVDYQTARQSDGQTYAKFFHLMLKHGVSLAPSQLEAGFLSALHGQSELERTQDAMEKSFAQLCQ